MNEDRKVLVLGIDGMDPRITKRMLRDKRLPNIQKYIDRGAAREDLCLLGAIPTITPPCWTTLSTGTYPGTHGITCYWGQSPDSLDAVVYNFDSTKCRAEAMWDVTVKADKKTLVWHWPGSSWPPTNNSPLLHVVDGTQPGSVNMGVAQSDWEKVIIAKSDIEDVQYAPRVERAPGMGCILTDIGDTVAAEKPVVETDEDENDVELWFGDAARSGREIRTYIVNYEDTETYVGSKVAYDIINSPLKPAAGWAYAPEGAKEFTVLTSDGIVKRPALLLKNDAGEYDSVAIYKSKKDEEPLVVIKKGAISECYVDTVNKNGELTLTCRIAKILEVDPQGELVRVWISNALDINNDTLWHPQALYQDIITNIGYVPPVSLIGGEEPELVGEIFEPSWDLYCQWQSRCLRYLIEKNQYDVVFSHLHNVDCAGHQLWHLAKTLPEWSYTDEKVYQGFIEKFYEQTDRYLGDFLPLLDEGWTIFIVSDHGLMVGENVPPILGDSSGLNVAVMEKLGYTVMQKDAEGHSTRKVDWTKTTAVQMRSNHIYINLKGRDKDGIVDPADKYELEDKIISDLYNYRDPATGKRVVSIAMRNKEALLIGLSGEGCGDIIFCIEEGFGRVHGDSMPTHYGYFDTSVSPIFIAAGQGIKENFVTDRVIRQVDVTPTIAAVLDLPVPAQCEGAPVYQILAK